MATSYDDAVEAIYRSSLDQFVSERKRLASELKQSGDKGAATRLSALKRPVVSAWAVNQLWWQARPAFEELLAAAAQLRAGDRSAALRHREALAQLRANATAVLNRAGHAPNDATLRRITATLLALGARGGFDPEPAGALAADLDPPGFEALSGGALDRGADEVAKVDPVGEPATPLDPDAMQAARERERAAALELERERHERDRRAREAERERLQAALGAAERQVQAKAADVSRLGAELALAESALAQSRQHVAELASQLEGLAD
jgi:hypothetical protein